MGVFSVKIEVGHTEGGPTEAMDALVDTGAFYSQVPASVLRRLGVESIRLESFELADGSVREFPVGWIRLLHDDIEVFSPVVFGGEVEPILGALTLELLAKVVDPVNQKLEPMKLKGRLTF